MKTFKHARKHARALCGVLIGLAFIGTAWAHARDYEFQLFQKELRKGDGARNTASGALLAP